MPKRQRSSKYESTATNAHPATDSPTAGASVELCGALTRLVGVILGIDHEVGMDSPCTGALPIVQWTVAWSRVVLTQVVGSASDERYKSATSLPSRFRGFFSSDQPFERCRCCIY